MSDERASPLARYLLLACTILIVYASLHPLLGWRDTGIDPFGFISAPRPRNLLWFDIIVNILGYAPFGFLAVLALRPAVRGLPALLLAAAGAMALSFGMESLQSYLPARTPSNIDFLANTAGGLLGAVVAAPLAARLLREGAMHVIRYRLFRPGGHVDLGLVLLGLWLLSQLNPETLLFGNGDLRELFQAPVSEHYPPDFFIRIEAFVAGANITAVGLFLALLTARSTSPRALFLAFIVLALLVRSLAYGVLFSSSNALLWATPGAMFGTAAGLLAVLIAVQLRRPAQLALCGLSLMAATVVVNLAPANPYLASSLAVWRQGPFLNFNGLTRLLSAAWPFIALAYLLALPASIRRAGADPRQL
jgi:VanZ family protein